MQSEMEPVHVHAPLPMPSPLNFQQALEMWGRACDDSEIKVEHEDTHECLISPSVESHTDQVLLCVSLAGRTHHLTYSTGNATHWLDIWIALGRIYTVEGHRPDTNAPFEAVFLPHAAGLCDIEPRTTIRAAPVRDGTAEYDGRRPGQGCSVRRGFRIRRRRI